MGKFCDAGPRPYREAGSGAAVADYLAGYGEALADRAVEHQPDRLAED